MPARAEFVHLHNHSEYSLLDGAIRIQDAISQAQAFGMPALALTDHGNLFGAVDFYQRAKETKDSDSPVKPVIGCEVYVAPGKRTDRDAGQGAAATSHLLLLARDRTGYQNLVKLVSLGYLEGFYYKPRVDREALVQHAGGLVAFSACLKGEIPRMLLAEKREKARELAGFYRELFGKGNFYLEVMNHGLPDEVTVGRELLSLAGELDLPLVATNDCHYLRRDHARAHDVLLCLQTGKDLNDPKRLRFTHDTFYMRSPEEMAALFAEMPQALAATLEVAEKCEFDLKPERHQLPDFPIPPGYRDAGHFLEAEARRGLERRFGGIAPEQEARLAFELETINKTGFATYFLIIKDLIDAARARGIPVGPGRGSVAGSLVAYALEITDIDPLRHDLLFERFLNPERVSMPDIDIDFCYERRNEVIEYARQRYGADSMAQIITFGTMAAKAAVRDVGRVMGIPYGEVDRLAKLVPGELKMTLEKALERTPELRETVNESLSYQELFEHAKQLEGISRHASTHAAGVVIAPGRLTDYVPLFQSSKGEVTTQYDMGSLEKLGLLKIDLLGLRTLTVIHDTLKLVRESRGEALQVRDLPLDDPGTYRLLADAHTVGVFQLESSGMRDLLRRLRPDCFEDVIAVNALYRPGPLGSGMVDDFINAKRGRKKIRYLHPDLEPVLRSTYGVILYQEQVMAIAHRLGGFSLGRADLLRRAMGKKDPQVMAEQRADFVEGAVARGVAQEKAESIFDLMAHFAGYGFNKSHSAAYALISVATAWLKTHHPLEFMAATMTSELGDSDRLVVLLEECRRMGTRVLPPDVNASEASFRVVPEGIRFGLAAVKNVGMGSVEAILGARETQGAFISLFDFTARVEAQGLNRRVLESLAQAGAFDAWGENRATLHASAPVALEHGQTVQRDRARGQSSLFGDDAAGADAWGGAAEPRLARVGPWSRQEFLSREKDALGLYLSGHPMEGWEHVLRSHAPMQIALLRERNDGDSVTVAGLVSACRRITDKKGNEMAFATIEDRTGSTEILVFADPFKRFGRVLQNGVALLVKGRVTAREEEDPKIVGQELQAVATLEPAPLPPAVPAEASEDGLHLAVDAAVGEGLLPALVALLRQHPGDTPLFLHLQTGEAAPVRVASRGMSVLPSSELLAELHELLGDHGKAWLAGR